MSIPTITPIETRYKKTTFRSRLEARWAVYFDTIGMRWEYEPEGFRMTNPWAKYPPRPPYLDPCLYVPDFWLPEVEAYAEVKPGLFGDFERYKAALLSCGSKMRVLLLDGPTG